MDRTRKDIRWGNRSHCVRPPSSCTLLSSPTSSPYCAGPTLLSAMAWPGLEFWQLSGDSGGGPGGGRRGQRWVLVLKGLQSPCVAGAQARTRSHAGHSDRTGRGHLFHPVRREHYFMHCLLPSVQL